LQNHSIWADHDAARFNDDASWSGLDAAKFNHDASWSGLDAARFNDDASWSGLDAARFNHDASWSNEDAAWFNHDAAWLGTGASFSSKLSQKRTLPFFLKSWRAGFNEIKRKPPKLNAVRLGESEPQGLLKIR
jgi:hypothetical protein